MHKVRNLIPESNLSAVRFARRFWPERTVPPAKFVVQRFFFIRLTLSIRQISITKRGNFQESIFFALVVSPNELERSGKIK